MDTNPNSAPTCVAELPTERVHALEVPALRTGYLRGSNLTNLMRDISYTTSFVLVQQSGRGRWANPDKARNNPVCYLFATDLWESICQNHQDLVPSTTEEYGARELRARFSQYMLQVNRQGVHVTVGTKYATADAWSNTFVPLSWGEKVIRKGLAPGM